MHVFKSTPTVHLFIRISNTITITIIRVCYTELLHVFAVAVLVEPRLYQISAVGVAVFAFFRENVVHLSVQSMVLTSTYPSGAPRAVPYFRLHASALFYH